MTLDELLDIGDATDDVYWPNPDLVGSQTVEGIDAMDGVPLVPSTRTRAGANGAPVAANAGDALVYDARASRPISAKRQLSRTARRAPTHSRKPWRRCGSPPMSSTARTCWSLSSGRGESWCNEDEDAPATTRPAGAVSDVVTTIADVLEDHAALPDDERSSRREVRQRGGPAADRHERRAGRVRLYLSKRSAQCSAIRSC